MEKPQTGLSSSEESSRCEGRERKCTGFVFDEACKRHVTGMGHPERPERLDAVRASLEQQGLLNRAETLKPRACDDRDILLCHEPEYLATVKQDIQQQAMQLRTGDTVICEQSMDIAKLAAGGILTAVDAVCSGQLHNAFCALRPPGHHATPDRGMGFCLFNNIAIGARYAQKKHAIEKVLIVDWDVHHGNGTQDIFYEDDSVFFFSTHQSPWYPGTGAADETGRGRGLGTTLNRPLPAGSGRERVLPAFTDRLLPAIESFKPQLVMISAGFDSRIDDPLGQFRLSDEDFAELTRVMLGVADDLAGGRVISVLEGGYNLDGLGKAAAAHFRALVEHN